MASDVLLLDAAFFALAAILYAYVGRVTLRRQVGTSGQLAAVLFGVWWFALAAVQVSNALARGLAWRGILDLDVHLTLLQVDVLVICVALWSLAYYLFYLLTGRREVLVPVSVFYVLLYVAILHLVNFQAPTAVLVEDWDVRLSYERTLGDVPLAALTLAILLPQILGALGYARLFFHAEDPTQRYRIGLVSVAILVWFGAALLAWLADVNGEPWWHVVERVVGLAAAVAICLAYRPIVWIRRRFGVRAIDEPSPA